MQKTISSLLLFSLILVCTSLIAQQKFTLTSKSFTNKAKLTAKYASIKMPGGKNISPAINWKNPPKGTKSFALACIDMTPIANHWVHWMVFNIPANINHISEGASGNDLPMGCYEALNSFGFEGYGGPQPPANTGSHKYAFTLFALNTSYIHPDKKRSDYKYFINLINKHIIAKTSIECFYK
ncbi:MAG: YbhB/YbcL family Raf kinase inhibitor-like protein [bacterium]|nr:YbhB/YbcL family Raf kinase inhibitor-like protein [bacterium]